jgi:hypothetical protein
MGRPTTGHLLEIRSKATGEVTSYSARVTHNGLRRNVPLDATTREKAVREMARMVDEQRRGVWFEPLPRRSRHFDEFANEWFARHCLEGGRHRTGLTPGSEADLRWRLDHLRGYFASAPISSITIADVDRYRLAKVQEGTLNATSINKLITTLAAILDTAVEYELIDRNPAKGAVVAFRRSSPAGRGLTGPIRSPRCSMPCMRSIARPSSEWASEARSSRPSCSPGFASARRSRSTGRMSTWG